MNEHYKENTCPECGKVFYPEYMLKWGWKNPKGEPVCSYTCQRKSEKNSVKKIQYRKDTKAVRIVETGEVFKSISECADRLDASVSWISKCVMKNKAFNGYHIERVVE